MRVIIDIPDALGEEVEELAASKGVSASSLYAEATKQYVKVALHINPTKKATCTNKPKAAQKSIVRA